MGCAPLAAGCFTELSGGIAGELWSHEGAWGLRTQICLAESFVMGTLVLPPGPY